MQLKDPKTSFCELKFLVFACLSHHTFLGEVTQVWSCPRWTKLVTPCCMASTPSWQKTELEPREPRKRSKKILSGMEATEMAGRICFSIMSYHYISVPLTDRYGPRYFCRQNIAKLECLEHHLYLNGVYPSPYFWRYKLQSIYIFPSLLVNIRTKINSKMSFGLEAPIQTRSLRN